MKENQFDVLLLEQYIKVGQPKNFVSKVNTLLIERGRNVEHIKDYPTTNMLPWEFKFRGDVPAKVEKNPIAASCYALEKTPYTFLLG